MGRRFARWSLVLVATGAAFFYTANNPILGPFSNKRFEKLLAPMLKKAGLACGPIFLTVDLRKKFFTVEASDLQGHFSAKSVCATGTLRRVFLALFNGQWIRVFQNINATLCAFSIDSTRVKAETVSVDREGDAFLIDAHKTCVVESGVTLEGCLKGRMDLDQTLRWTWTGTPILSKASGTVLLKNLNENTKVDVEGVAFEIPFTLQGPAKRFVLKTKKPFSSQALLKMRDLVSIPKTLPNATVETLELVLNADRLCTAQANLKASLSAAAPWLPEKYKKLQGTFTTTAKYTHETKILDLSGRCENLKLSEVSVHFPLVTFHGSAGLKEGFSKANLNKILKTLVIEGKGTALQVPISFKTENGFVTGDVVAPSFSEAPWISVSHPIMVHMRAPLSFEGVRAAVDVRLQENTVESPVLNWSKPLKEPFTVQADFFLDFSHPTAFRVSNVRTQGGDLKLGGNFSQNAQGQDLNLSVFRQNQHDFSLAFCKKPTENTVCLQGALADVRGALKHLPAWLERPSTGPGKKNTVSLALGTVLIEKGHFTNMQGAVAAQAGTLQTLEASAFVNETAQWTLHQNVDRSFCFKTNDAGLFLDTLFGKNALQKGDLTVEMRPKTGTKGYNGSVVLKNFSLSNEGALFAILQKVLLSLTPLATVAPLVPLLPFLPVLSIAGLASLPGTLDFRKNMHFDRLTADFFYENSRLTLFNLLGNSFSHGIKINGTVDFDKQALDLDCLFISSYYLSKLFGSTPVLGKMLAGKKGDSLTGTVFRVAGPFEGYTVSAHPLSSFTPGFLRGLFAPLTKTIHIQHTKSAPARPQPAKKR